MGRRRDVEEKVEFVVVLPLELAKKMTEGVVVREEEVVMLAGEGERKRERKPIFCFLFSSYFIVGLEQDKKICHVCSGVMCVWFKRVYMNLFPK